jgi:methionyl-tRNA synthetase
VPDYRFNEIKAFVERGLEDFSISRRKEKMPWGIPVPGDDEHVMYVWFDALINYVSTLGWPEDTASFEKFWGTVGQPNALQVAGKDNLRQQSAMWQAMLMSAGLPTSKQIMIHGFITSGGQKMSKSLGNVIDPLAIVDEYGVDALRYFLARHIHPFEDSDFTMEKFKDAYNANLANGIGNLASRIMTLAQTHLTKPVDIASVQTLDEVYTRGLDSYHYNSACDFVWGKIGILDQRLATEKPFSVVKTNPEEGKRMIAECVLELYEIAYLLQPIMPATSEAIVEAIKTNTKPPNLFPRKE